MLVIIVTIFTLLASAYFLFSILFKKRRPNNNLTANNLVSAANIKSNKKSHFTQNKQIECKTTLHSNAIKYLQLKLDPSTFITISFSKVLFTYYCTVCILPILLLLL